MKINYRNILLFLVGISTNSALRNFVIFSHLKLQMSSGLLKQDKKYLYP